MYLVERGGRGGRGNFKRLRNEGALVLTNIVAYPLLCRFFPVFVIICKVSDGLGYKCESCKNTVIKNTISTCF